MLLWSKVSHIRKLAGHIVCKFVIWWTGWVPIFVDKKADSVMPDVAAPQDFLKVFLESEFGVESDS